MKHIKTKKSIHVIVILLLVSTLVQCIALGAVAKIRRENKKRDAYIYGQSVVDSIQFTLDNTLEASESLKYFYVTYGEKCFDDFERFAAEIAKDNPVIGSMYIAPKGVIQVAYPKEVNEATIGFEMLKDPEQGPRAQLAIDTKRITVAGPHDLVEGGVGFIIRNPIFEDDEFKGFTIIVLDWDQFVSQVLDHTVASTREYKFAVWKQDYDEHAVTDEDGYIFRNSDETISKDVDIKLAVPNDTWHLVVEPMDGWRVYNEMVLEIAVSVVVSLTLVVLCAIVYLAEERKHLLEQEIQANIEREKYMDQLAEALSKAEQANQAKTMFLNNMSHDIRTPMNAIMGFAKLIEMKKDEPGAIENYVEKIKESGEYLLSIINNILDMARIESGKTELDLEGVNLTHMQKSILALFVDEMEKKNLKFTHSMKVAHNTILADEAKLKQVMVNLLSNAVKYTPEGGAVDFSIVEQESDKKDYATYLVQISDTGVGMSKEFQENLFDSFTRERTSTESKISGTGLGTSIVKKLVDLMGGTIEVESEPGKGSTFSVRVTQMIMQDPKVYQEENKNDVRIFDLAKKRILLAEDNDLNAEIATAILENAGLLIERVKDGIECVDALVKAEDGYFDLILMDIQMPNLNGYLATVKIRELEDTKKASIPVVAMTANAFEEDKRLALEAGMNGHLAKPIDVNEMMECITKLLNQENNT